ncbi:putative L-gulonolactone oxidase 4 [Folsomia candida]|uniref:Putative L-gulonolactone oxidase 4 n=2 Tax=Folsomia candida TaxID=158441 RepID=A0A226DLR9_FOLCA|nr:putative L-gulonolactone oxidase 4 [Folsomia candida]
MTATSLGPCPPLPDFPPTSTYTLRPFKTYASDVVIPFCYFSSPRDTPEVLSLANWAKNAGYRVRGVGRMHSWSPITLSKYEPGNICPKFLLVDTTKYLTDIKVTTDFNTSLHSVTLGPGVTLGRLLKTLESHQLGLFSCPAHDDLTVGGMLAVGAHGSGIKTATHPKSLGHAYGTFSNLVLEMDVIAWDNHTRKYVVKTLPRSHPDTKAFLVNLGRTFVTRVKIRVGADQMLRSQTFFTTVRQLFGTVRDDDKPNLADFLDLYGRIHAFSLGTGGDSNAFLFAWHSEPEKQTTSKFKDTPYNYHFDNYPPVFNTILRLVLTRVPHIWEFLSRLVFRVVVVVSYLNGSRDYWGLSKNHFLYVPKNSPILRANSFVVVTSRQNFQTVVSIIRKDYDDLASEWHVRGEYPNAGTFDIRVSGVEDPENILAEGADAEPPIFSPAKLVPSHPEYDIVIWFEFATFPETRKAQEFLASLQSRLYRDIHQVHGVLRAEWAKGWAHTGEQAWDNRTIFNTFPYVFSSSKELSEWNLGVEILERYDPWRVFGNGLLDRILIEA